MKRITTLLIFLFLCADCLAQSPEQTVRQYVSLLNDWLASPYNAEKRNKVLSILNGGQSAMKDEIVERYNADAGVRHTSPGNYLAIFYEQTTTSRVKVEIVSLKEVVYDGEKYVVAVLKYSGGISLTTASDFWVSNGKITGIVSNEREIAKLRSGDKEPEKPAVTSPVQKHEYIDLGLPSGTLWATCNVGADNPWDYGDYFAWGETTTKSTYSWSNYKYCKDGDFHKFTKYCNQSDYGNNGYTDSRTTLERSDDAAAANWGIKWRMPTADECWELKNNCIWEWTTNYNGMGVAGHIVRSKRYPDRYIFFPAAGWREGLNTIKAGHSGGYWSSMVHSDSRYGLDLDFDLDQVHGNGVSRFCGRSIRPVRNTH